MTTDILIIGGGPAGLITAIGLVKLGYRATVVSVSRPHSVIEGMSERVVGALNYCGCRHALNTLSAPVARQIVWDGVIRSANVEQLLDREAFDQALLLDAQAQGVETISGRVTSLKFDNNQWHAKAQTEKPQSLELSAPYLVDARGRAAPLGKAERSRGPESVTVYQNWETPGVEPFVSVVAVDSGWLWTANNGQGRLYTQFTTDKNTGLLTRKADILATIRDQLAKVEHGGPVVTELKASGSPGARGSTAIMPGRSIDACSIKVGDAAMAGDPLSGNGIFMALSSALIAPAVINTQLKRKNSANLAMEFYQARLDHLFIRFARIGRDFYRQQTRWQNSNFWKPRSVWPDSSPAHAVDNQLVDVANRPVVNNGWIETRQVLITTDNPLGIWKVDGKDIADLATVSNAKIP